MSADTEQTGTRAWLQKQSDAAGSWIRKNPKKTGAVGGAASVTCIYFIVDTLADMQSSKPDKSTDPLDMFRERMQDWAKTKWPDGPPTIEPPVWPENPPWCDWEWPMPGQPPWNDWPWPPDISFPPGGWESHTDFAMQLPPEGALASLEEQMGAMHDPGHDDHIPFDSGTSNAEIALLVVVGLILLGAMAAGVHHLYQTHTQRKLELGKAGAGEDVAGENELQSTTGNRNGATS